MASNLNPIAAPVSLLQTPLVDLTAAMVTRPWFPFFTGVQNLLATGVVPVFNVATFGAPTNGRDASVGLTQAYAAAVAAGGGIIYAGPGTYTLTNPWILNGTVPITIMGAGRSTIFSRGANMPAGVGMFDLQAAQNVTFQDFLVDGAVTTPVGLMYSQLNGDPLNPLLTANTSFWLHDGCSEINWSGVTVQHTGGYSVLVQAVQQNITDLSFFDFHLLNNRPNLFGNVATDLNYGSWTGGVLLHADGVAGTGTVSRVDFLKCSARRCTGTAFWTGHLYSFNVMFDGIRFTDIYAEDCGRDIIQLGATLGTRIDGVTGRRIGYVTTDDTSPSTAAWLSDEWAVAIDCGPCFGTVIDNIDLTSVNGGSVDLDGMVATVLSNFLLRTPLPGDPEYLEDGIGNVGWAGATTAGGPNSAYGILMAPAGYGPFSEGGHRVSAGTIINMSAGAVRMYGSHSSSLSDVNIVHPAVNNGAPVQIGNIGSANLQRSYGNTVTNCHFEYNPATPQACVQEVAGAAPFLATDINQVLGNQVESTTGATEFSKDPNSGSIGSVTAIETLSGLTKLTFTSGFLTAAQ